MSPSTNVRALTGLAIRADMLICPSSLLRERTKGERQSSKMCFKVSSAFLQHLQRLSSSILSLALNRPINSDSPVLSRAKVTCFARDRPTLIFFESVSLVESLCRKRWAVQSSSLLNASRLFIFPLTLALIANIGIEASPWVDVQIDKAWFA